MEAIDRGSNRSSEATSKKALEALEKRGALAFRDASEVVNGDNPTIAEAKRVTTAAYESCKDVEP